MKKSTRADMGIPHRFYKLLLDPGAVIGRLIDMKGVDKEALQQGLLGINERIISTQIARPGGIWCILWREAQGVADWGRLPGFHAQRFVPPRTTD